MTCRLVNEKKFNLIPMVQLQSGQIGVVVAGDNDSNNGTIVQRNSLGYEFVIIGGSMSGSLRGPSNGYSGDCINRIMVRPLEPGEMIEVKYDRTM